jgi:hypothetical protein
MDTPKRKGRPPLDPRVRRTAKVEARLSPIERAELDRKLADLGMSETEYVRQRLGLASVAA